MRCTTTARRPGASPRCRSGRTTRRKPAFLINSVYEANGAEIAAGVARYDAVFARDELSREALAEAGIAATVVPDLTLSWQPPVTRGNGRQVVVTDSTVQDTNARLHTMARAIGARYLPLMARPPQPIVKAHADASRWWRYAAKRLLAHLAPPGLWRDRWRGLIPDFDDYIAWMAENAGLVVAGRFHGVCIALDLGNSGAGRARPTPGRSRRCSPAPAWSTGSCRTSKSCSID